MPNRPMSEFYHAQRALARCLASVGFHRVVQWWAIKGTVGPCGDAAAFFRRAIAAPWAILPMTQSSSNWAVCAMRPPTPRCRVDSGLIDEPKPVHAEGGSPEASEYLARRMLAGSEEGGQA
jgi:hypothetical protein